nr:hypothetical protein [Micromonospora sp. DSM 115978]
HHVDSLHLYAGNTDDATTAARSESVADTAVAMEPLAVDWADLDAVLSRVIAGDDRALAGTSWAAFARVLASYRAWRSGDRDAARSLADDTAGPLGEALCRWYARLARPPAAGVGTKAGRR